MYILGIDPGYRKLGYAVVDFATSSPSIIDSAILLQNAQDEPDPYIRIYHIYQYFQNMLYNLNIDAIVMEKLFFTSANKNNAEYVYSIRGVLINMFINKSISIYQITPTQVKQYITGNTRSSKIAVQNMIQKIYNLQDLPKYNDSADALAMAYIGSRLHR